MAIIIKGESFFLFFRRVGNLTKRVNKVGKETNLLFFISARFPSRSQALENLIFSSLKKDRQ
jgi:hypothetical protein